ncbi:MAG: hypothetical protein QXF76_02290 [Candidatus Anstonellales archaeon]
MQFVDIVSNDFEINNPELSSILKILKISKFFKLCEINSLIFISAEQKFSKIINAIKCNQTKTIFYLPEKFDSSLLEKFIKIYNYSNAEIEIIILFPISYLISNKFIIPSASSFINKCLDKGFRIKSCTLANNIHDLRSLEEHYFILREVLSVEHNVAKSICYYDPTKVC